MSTTTTNNFVDSKQPLDARGPPVTEVANDDDDYDAQIAALMEKKAERLRREREEEKRRLAEEARKAEESRREMTKAAVAWMMAEREAAATRNEAEREAEGTTSGGPTAGDSERGHKRARSTTCGRCLRRGIDCAWPASSRATSCLPCQTAKAKCGGSPVRKQVRKEYRREQPESEEDEDGGVYLWEMERINKTVVKRLEKMETRLSVIERALRKQRTREKELSKVMREVKDFLCWSEVVDSDEESGSTETASDAESDAGQEIVGELAGLEEEKAELARKRREKREAAEARRRAAEKGKGKAKE